MEKGLSFVLFFLLCHIVTYAQREMEVHGVATVRMDEDMTLASVKRKVIDDAKKEAVKEAFGTVITHNVVTQTTVEDGVEKSNFVERAGEKAKGRWLADTQPAKLSVNYDGTSLTFTAEVWGKAREIVKAEADLVVEVLNRPAADAKANTFNNGDNVYLHFKSPSAGYLAIYLLDTKQVSCLLPYRQIKQGTFPVEAGKDYILFDPETDKNCLRPYRLTTRMSVETNEIVVVFSPHVFYKANDNKGGFNQLNTLDVVAFNEWLLKSQEQDGEMVVTPIEIKIINNY